MSTKTTLKRIALVAVSALGMGLLASAPSQAANTTTTAFTKSQTVSTSYLTVVGAAAETGTAAGFFYVDVTNESAAANAASVVGLSVGNETMTVSVTSAPTGASANMVAIRPVKQESATGTTGLALRFTRNTAETWTAGSYQLSGSRITNNESNDFTPVATTAPTGRAKRYWFAVSVGGAANSAAVSAGYFTLRVRTQTADSRTIDSTVYVQFVPTIADANAKITLSGTGTLFTGETLTYQAGRYYQAVLAGATNNDRIQLGQSVAVTNTAGLESATALSIVPPMTATLTTSAGVEIASSNLEATDDGDSGQDYAFTATTATTGGTLGTDENYADARNLANGVYGITNNGTGNGFPTLTDISTNLLRVRLTNSSVQATLAVSTGAARSSATSVTTKIAGTGVAAADTFYQTSAVTATTAGAAIAYKLPLTNKSVTLTIDDQTSGARNLTTTTTWSGNYASASVTPATDTALTTASNADGEITRVITNSSPLAGAVATVTVTGFADPDKSVVITFTWEAAKATTIAIVEPVASVHTALKGTTNFTVSVKDQFGNLMAGELLQPAVGGSAGVGNYSATKTYSPITTDASGLATWSLTDAAAKADDTDSISFSSISNSAATPATYTITYKTTVAAVSSFLEYYNNNWGDGTIQGTINTTIPTTGITGATTSKLAIIGGLNLSNGRLAAYDDGSDDAAVAVRIRSLTSAGAPATGAAVTVTAATGGWIVGAAGTPVTSRTFAVPTSGDVSMQVLATAPGSIKFTVTSGTASDSFTLEVATPTTAAARTIAISGGSSGTANGEGVPMTVTVKDRYGNSVSGVLLTVAASGVGSFLGGGTTQSFTTDASGTYTFLATSIVSAGGTGAFAASIASSGTDATSSAGYFGNTEVDSTLAAGVSSASKSVTFAAGINAAQAAAEAATDAAAEAIDAANAATDAANLAAEAADAATVAAEEARDAADAATAAVEELATQVATLMAALKAQITTLANTVAKIAKKVKA